MWLLIKAITKDSNVEEEKRQHREISTCENIFIAISEKIQNSRPSVPGTI